jgi:hypothetical protein
MAKKLIGKGPKKYHMNNDRQVHECEATVRECKYRDKPHGSLEEVGCEAEALALERFEEERRAKREEFAKRRLAKQRGRGRKAKRAAPVGEAVVSKPVVVESVSSVPKPSVPKPSAPKPSMPSPRVVPVRAGAQSRNVASTPLRPGDLRVVGADGKPYIYPSATPVPPQTEEEYLIELEKQRVFLDRARYITDRDKKLRSSKTSPAEKRALSRELDEERKAAEAAGLPWDVPQVRALWNYKRKVAKETGTRPHWARLTKNQRQITYQQMDEQSIERFRQYVRDIDLRRLAPSGHVMEKLASGKLAALDAEDIFATLEDYTPGTYSITEYDDRRSGGRSISIRSKGHTRVVAPEQGAEPTECNLILVISVDGPKKDSIVTAYWKPVNEHPQNKGIRFQDRWLKVT